MGDQDAGAATSGSAALGRQSASPHLFSDRADRSGGDGRK